MVNTRKDCFDLFQLMPQGTIHLSALMCGEHRSKVIEKIKKALQKGLPIRVISTQLVEAGVDIDFPVVYRALSGLDSVAQSGGRCNREGTLNTVGKLGRIVVFIPPKHSPGGLLRKGEDTTRELIHTGKINLDHPDIFDRYFSLFYGKVNDTGDKFKDWLIKDAPDLHVQFRTAAKAFNLIEQTSRPLFVTYGNSGKFLKELRHIGPTRENMRKLQRYSVNVSKTDFEKIKHQGLIDEVWPEFWAWLGPYSNSHGLDIFGQGWAPEDLIS
ncbi:MAG: hypothetical protein HUK40_06715 [Desulfobacter sp.]|nr:hypothetical protein [Desulfobacter sp.]